MAAEGIFKALLGGWVPDGGTWLPTGGPSSGGDLHLGGGGGRGTDMCMVTEPLGGEMTV